MMDLFNLNNEKLTRMTKFSLWKTGLEDAFQRFQSDQFSI